MANNLSSNTVRLYFTNSYRDLWDLVPQNRKPLIVSDGDLNPRTGSTTKALHQYEAVRT